MKKSDKISRLDFLPLFYPTNKTASLITFDVNVFKFFSLPIFSKKYFSSRHIVNMWSILLSRHSNEIYWRVTEILQKKLFSENWSCFESYHFFYVYSLLLKTYSYTQLTSVRQKRCLLHEKNWMSHKKNCNTIKIILLKCTNFDHWQWSFTLWITHLKWNSSNN